MKELKDMLKEMQNKECMMHIQIYFFIEREESQKKKKDAIEEMWGLSSSKNNDSWNELWGRKSGGQFIGKCLRKQTNVGGLQIQKTIP